MKENTYKLVSPSHRFSPLAHSPSLEVLSGPLRPLLRRPRDASLKTLTQHGTSKFFVSEAADEEDPVDGQGALCSQLTETQYFAQFGVDVSAVSVNSSPVSAKCANGAVMSPQLRLLPHFLALKTESEASEDLFEEDYRNQPQYEDEDNFESAVSQLMPGNFGLSNKHRLILTILIDENIPESAPAYLKPEPSSPVIKPLSHPSTPSPSASPTMHTSSAGGAWQLTASEQWMVEKMREAHAAGLPLARGFVQQYRERERASRAKCRALEIERDDLLEQLEKIHCITKAVCF
ncbi:hypothetical protein C8J57DRAFT_1241340 [Mycena rebaudengoi]|nr:hypothetical protein C8J57DRAFT_1241340 [Mycena rebaudengoi]